MEKIKITFLGTGCAIPTKRRNHPAILLSYIGENILIDCGEGTQRQLRIAGINPCSITKILITHWHGDHVLGIPGLVQTLELNNYNKELEIYGPEGTKKFMDLYLNLFVHREKINIRIKEIKQETFFKSDFFNLSSSSMNHNTPSLAYSFEIPDRLRLKKELIEKLKIPNGPLIGELKKGKIISFNGKKISGKKITYNEKGKKITIILDTIINNNCYKIAKNSDLLITEATFSEKEIENAKKSFHLTAKQSAQIAKKSKSKKLILMHPSQRFEKNSSALLEEAKQVFNNTILAEDFLSLEI